MILVKLSFFRSIITILKILEFSFLFHVFLCIKTMFLLISYIFIILYYNFAFFVYHAFKIKFASPKWISTYFRGSLKYSHSLKKEKKNWVPVIANSFYLKTLSVVYNE